HTKRTPKSFSKVPHRARPSTNIVGYQRGYSLDSCLQALLKSINMAAWGAANWELPRTFSHFPELPKILIIRCLAVGLRSKVCASVLSHPSKKWGKKNVVVRRLCVRFAIVAF